MSADLGINWRLLGQGQTVGKWLLKIRIVLRQDGEQPAGRLRIVTRRMLPIWIVYYLPRPWPILALVDGVLIFRAGRNTLHDGLAGTKVIRVLPE